MRTAIGKRALASAARFALLDQLTGCGHRASRTGGGGAGGSTGGE